MVYKYKCKKCDEETTINKSMADSSRVEHCKKCKSVLDRVYSIGAIKTGDGTK